MTILFGKIANLIKPENIDLNDTKPLLNEYEQKIIESDIFFCALITPELVKQEMEKLSTSIDAQIKVGGTFSNITIDALNARHAKLSDALEKARLTKKLLGV